MNRVRVRFAPSPTGYLHIGGLRTALYNVLFARRHGGDFILRIEDTDQKRFVEDAEQDILDSLDWAGIAFDEGPGGSGAYGPYRQSERSDLYREIVDRLLASGHAYLAFDTEEELDSLRNALASDQNLNPRYDHATRDRMKNSLSLGPEQVERLRKEGVPSVVRLKVTPGSRVVFTDLIRGEVTFETDHVDDQVLMKSDGLPTYHLANIVDDHYMKITHVIRGEEWLPSTPKHMLLYQALGWDPPEMAHLPLILSPTGGKLSKRSAERAGIPVSVREYRSLGYEPGALVNFLALLGWNPGDETELYTLEELTAVFSIDRVGQSGVQFDLNKLAWFNEHYLRARSSASIAAEFKSILIRADIDETQEYLERIADLMRDRITFAADILEARYFFEDPTAFDEPARKKRWKEGSKDLVEAYADSIESLDIYDAVALEEALRDLADARGVGAGNIIHPVRLAVSGVSAGPGLFELLFVLGQETSVRRLRTSAQRLG